MAVGARQMNGGNDNLLFYRLPSLASEVLLLLLVLCASIAATLLLIRCYRHPVA